MTTRLIQPGEIGADYVSISNKTKALLEAHRVTNVTRYVKPGHSAYEILAPERDLLFSWGIALTIVFETNESAILGGASTGAQHGDLAAVDCDALEYPHECAIFAAVDTDVVRANADLCNSYLRAFYRTSAPWADGGYFDTEGYKLVRDLNPIWCKPNASGWDQDPSLRPLAHILQGHQDLTLGWDYPNVCKRPFLAWTGLSVTPPVQPVPPIETAPPVVVTPPPITSSKETGMVVIVTNPPQYNAEFIGELLVDDTGKETALKFIWIKDDAGRRARDLHRANGAVERHYDLSLFEGFFLSERPSGDGARDWSTVSIGGIG